MNIPIAPMAKLHNQQSHTCTEPFNRYFTMTVDVDGWSSLLSFYSVNHDPQKADAQVSIEEGISKLLRLFEKHKIKATFFVSGDMAIKHPNIIQLISEKEHEVACHGLLHQKNECQQGISEQKRLIHEATVILEKKTGIRPKGFRAPVLRCNKATFSVLNENGYIYDSTVIPTFIPGYYGQLDLKFKPYWIPLGPRDVENHQRLLEIPVSVNPIFPLPLSAAWMRNFGSSWVKFGIKANFLLGNPVVFYVHPRDVLTLPKVNGIPWHIYRNVGSPTIKMLDNMFKYVKALNGVFLKAIDLASLMSNEDGEKEFF